MYRFGPFLLDSQRRLLYRGGMPLHLTAKVLHLLEILVERQGQVVTKEDLLQLLWPDSIGTEANLTVNIAALRKCLGEKRTDHRYVVTVPTRGYSFVAEVEKVDSIGAYPVSPALQIAVLPPHLDSPRPNEEHLPSGIADGIIGKLAGLRGVAVRSMPSSSDLRLLSLPPDQIARKLKVDLVLHGSLKRRGRVLDLHLELTDPTKKEVLWSQSFENVIHGLPFALAAAVGEVSAILQLEPVAKNTSRVPENPRAYNLYLEGRFYLSRFHPMSLEKARKTFLQSLQIDGTYPRAWASLGLTYQYLVYFGRISPAEGHAKSEEAANSALELDPQSSLAHVLLGNVFRNLRWDWESSGRHHQWAVDLGPLSSFAHEHLAYHQLSLGEFGPAITELHRALQLDPTSLTLHTSLSWALRMQRNIEASRASADTALRMDPGFLLAHYHAACNDFLAGDYQAALDRLLTYEDDAATNPYLQALIGHAYGGLGNKTAMLRSLERIARDDSMRSTRALHSGIALAGAGEAEACIDQLEIAAEERHGFVAYLEYDPLWDQVRTNPRFTSLTHRIRFHAQRAKQ